MPPSPAAALPPRHTCRRHRSGTDGFTLLEVMAAVVLTAVVALMAYSAAHVSVAARSAVERDLKAVRSGRAVRQLLVDLLHNVRLPRHRGDTAFALRLDTLSFSAAGAPPLDAERDWSITLRPGEHGLELVAVPLGRGDSGAVAFRLAQLTRAEVRVLGPGGSEWLRKWDPGRTVPRAVAITFWLDREPNGPPLEVALSHQPALTQAEEAADE